MSSSLLSLCAVTYPGNLPLTKVLRGPTLHRTGAGVHETLIDCSAGEKVRGDGDALQLGRDSKAAVTFDARDGKKKNSTAAKATTKDVPCTRPPARLRGNEMRGPGRFAHGRHARKVYQKDEPRPPIKNHS